MSAKTVSYDNFLSQGSQEEEKVSNKIFIIPPPKTPLRHRVGVGIGVKVGAGVNVGVGTTDELLGENVSV